MLCSKGRKGKQLGPMGLHDLIAMKAFVYGSNNLPSMVLPYVICLVSSGMLRIKQSIIILLAILGPTIDYHRVAITLHIN